MRYQHANADVGMDAKKDSKEENLSRDTEIIEYIRPKITALSQLRQVTVWQSSLRSLAVM